ncbi:MAG: hypothetical protein CGU28_16395 [Candidatus Dactylopiibacterium carminicum]|uniref:BcpO-related WXXGXW repeat protein n=1 Tax=Candidatus Dactylopiibacterium carminicum TaxID=857335 RepID=A0A272EMW5_9RHOO|nr:YXWGXW repeat-containing protein [Candidatus Dactylopiibacterium carminicum]KAF7597860.1 hypothetical protein BGI27_16480 [Candidatus Dactylopiibacterium carminicum]PAS91449.1 MAG: hypothetical protein CGU29_16435 [Candidatus Dactylopiibacterium carminicum]PAS92622.1 MAG: hypothetical protein CGU28_16395 [Candidatus Dactylopiibacterium carminicum]PAS95756.1 MAG: hypothetical protein BSR46_16520 [Candidatus Dactylopiibacterium carminicum]
MNTRNILASLGIAAASLILSPVSQAEVNISVNLPGITIGINDAPPPVRLEKIPARRSGYVWAPGYWQWDGHAHVWISGHWLAERPGHVWIPERWERNDRGWTFTPGRWDQRRNDWRAEQRREQAKWEQWRTDDRRRNSEWQSQQKHQQVQPTAQRAPAQAAHDMRSPDKGERQHEAPRRQQHDDPHGPKDRDDRGR